ncbi:MAG TPA: nitroreductase/quinone reductase family protein [Ktedonobacterales bacterium]
MSQSITHVSYFTVIMHALTGGRAYRGDESSPAGFLKLTTTGRKTGMQRTTELVYLRDGADYVVTASYGGGPRNPSWFYNLRSNPDVTIDVHGGRKRGVAEVADPEKRKELWARLIAIAPMYRGYEKRTQREIPMVIVHPAAEG